MSRPAAQRLTIHTVSDAPVASVAAQAYRDLASPAAQRLGQTVSRALGVALAPVNGALWTAEQALAWLEREVQARFVERDVPEAAIQPPPASVLGATVLGVQAAAGEPKLSSLFAELLATAMDARRAGAVHPAFAEIIRQLLPDEARLLARIAQVGSVHFETRKGARRDSSLYEHERVREHLPGTELARRAGCKRPAEALAYVTNLERLGLVEERMRQVGSIAAEASGTPIPPNTPYLVELALTPFGQRFRTCCIAH